MKNYHFVASSALVLSASAFAQIAIDGTAEAAYGPAAVVQSVGTGFGNSTDGLKGTCNGSELDGAFASLDATAGYMKSHKLEVPALLDGDGKVGQEYGARTTPQLMLAVLDEMGLFGFESEWIGSAVAG